MNESISDEAVYRTAPATPGLLKIRILVNLCLQYMHPIDLQKARKFCVWSN